MRPPPHSAGFCGRLTRRARVVAAACSFAVFLSLGGSRDSTAAPNGVPAMRAVEGTGSGSFVPSSARSAGPRKRLAIVFHGLTGAMSWDEHVAFREGRGLPSSRVAVISWAAMQRHVVDANARKGWDTDVFFHTWDANCAEDVAKVLGARSFSAGVVELNGYTVRSGAWASGEVAMLVMREWNAAQRAGQRGEGGARPGFNAAACPYHAPNASVCGGVWRTDDWAEQRGGYDRIIVSRFDTLFHVPFLADKLTLNDALYAASWCKATGSGLPVPEPFHACKFLNFFHYDIEKRGLPDFFFAGSERVMWTLYAHWHEDQEIPRFVPNHAPPNHGIIRGRVDYKQLKIRRYLFHDMDFDLVRNTWCNVPKYAAEAEGNYSTVAPWWERGETDVSDTPLDVSDPTAEYSLCEGGRYFCALESREIGQNGGCGGFIYS